MLQEGNQLKHPVPEKDEQLAEEYQWNVKTMAGQKLGSHQASFQR